MFPLRLFSFLILALTASAETPRPNILWMIAEDFGPHLGCYGTKEVSTPVLDAMAAKGMRFTRYYTTAPVCSPSRSGSIAAVIPMASPRGSRILLSGLV